VFFTSSVFLLVVNFMFVVGYNPQQHKIKHKIKNMKIMLLMLRFFIFVGVCFSGWFCVCCRLQSSSTQNIRSKAWKSCFYCCVFYFVCFCFSDWFCICCEYNPQPHKTQDYVFVVMLCFLILVIASQLKTIIKIKPNIHKEYKINMSFVLIHQNNIYFFIF